MTDVWVSAAPVLLEALAETRVLRRSREASGCLTGESEERETWTAESLRAASSNGEASAFPEESGHWKRLWRSTFKVTLLDFAELRLRGRQEWDLVKMTARGASAPSAVVCET